MTTCKICGCQYKDSKGKYHYGIYILNRRKNIFTVLDKNLEKVKNYVGIITCESSIGNMFIHI